jgi:hypothetical protein
VYGDTSINANCEAEGTAFQLINQGGTALLNTIEVTQ